ncbi:hypothetical protein BGZ52_008355 [Haplosporangium bisporale]|nr:hypothetical protein BGZ52_008355 [Haplosporangium bisporale]
MKLTSILTVAAALCALTVNAAPETHSNKDIHLSSTDPSITPLNAKPKPKPTKTKAKPKPKPTKTTSKPKPKPTKPSKANDPCAIIAKEAKNSGANLSYSAVKGCFEAHKFRKDIADKVLTSVENVLGNFYAFVDQARDPYLNNGRDAPKPGSSSVFDTPPVDLMKELAKMRTTKYKNDYEFHMALTFLTLSVNDGHLTYRNSCYDTVSFGQPLILYAPVVNNKQTVQVFHADTSKQAKLPANTPKDLVDCAVTAIDGVPALEAIQTFTDKHSALSKDPGVRLNDALGSVSWDENWGIYPGGFARRWALPAKPTMDYTLQCGASKPVTIKVPWRITPSDAFEYGIFDDTKSYWEVQCVGNAHSDSANFINQAQRNKSAVNGSEAKEEVAPATEFFRQRGKIEIAAPPRRSNGRAPTNDEPQVITRAKEIFTTGTTAFFMLSGSANKDKCVAVISNEDAGDFHFQNEDYVNFFKGFQMLQDRGCKKLILDMTNNGGGSVDFAYFVNKVFFPKEDAFFVQDLAANTMVQEVAKVASTKKYKGDDGSMFDARRYVRFATKQTFKDATMFTKGSTTQRGGKTVSLSQRNYFEHGWPFLPLKGNKVLNWKPEDMAIVTNGYCGSACTMIATRFSVVHGVKTYAVGGIQNRDLSYFTFPGGFVLTNAAIVGDLNALKFKPRGKDAARRPVDLPVMADTRLTVGEIYAFANSTVPLEYDAQYFAATVHLDLDTVSARHPDQTWLKIAKDF